MLEVLLLALASAGAIQDVPTARPWPHESSDIPVDPRVRFGRLDNGLRYASAVSATPRNHCYLRLHVDAGSLHERDDELGMAHFVEHMAFNGSRHFPPGAVHDWLREHGLSPGADSNAFTSFGATLYKLDLPRADAHSVAQALRVLRDFADGALFEADEVEREKGVIDAEERVRDTPQARIMLAHLRHLAQGTRFADRQPIGVKSVRDAFTAEKLRAFYRRWYRPERTTLVVVGDIAGLDLPRMLEDAFESWSGSDTPAEADPALGEATLDSSTWSVIEPDFPICEITCFRVAPPFERAINKAELIDELRRTCVREILDARFAALAAEPGASVLEARINPLDGRLLARAPCTGEGLTIRCRPDQWRDALRQCARELRRAREFGFEADEVARVRKSWVDGLAAQAKYDAQRSSTDWAAMLVAALERTVPLSATTEHEILRSTAEDLTSDECGRTLASMWGSGKLMIGVGGRLDLGAEGSAELRDVWDAAWTAAPAQPSEVKSSEWAYASTAASGAIASHVHIDEVRVERLELDNGVRVSIKRTDFAKGEVLVSCYLGNGARAFAPEQCALAAVAPAVAACGLGAHSVAEIQQLMANRDVHVETTLGLDAFEIRGSTTAPALLTECGLICAYLSDPGWREEGWAGERERVAIAYDQAEHDLWGPYKLDFVPAVFGDTRLGMPPRASVEALTFADFKSWLAPELAHGSLDVAIIGDLELERAVEVVRKTFGLLPRRRASDAGVVVLRARAGVEMEREIASDASNALVVLTFPACDGTEPRARAALRLLREVVGMRLAREVRERLGGAYHPSASSLASTTMPGLGYLQVQVMCEPARVRELLEACYGVTDALARDGVGADELERARAPALTRGLADRRSNDYWSWRLLEASRLRPTALEELQRSPQTYAAVTAEEVSVLAKRYLTRDNSSRLIVVPKKR